MVFICCLLNLKENPGQNLCVEATSNRILKVVVIIGKAVIKQLMEQLQYKAPYDSQISMH